MDKRVREYTQEELKILYDKGKPVVVGNNRCRLHYIRGKWGYVIVLVNNKYYRVCHIDYKIIPAKTITAMTYDERIHAIAEEMAEAEWLTLPGNEHHKFRDTNVQARQIWINDNLYAAQIAIKHMAAAVKAALLKGEPDPINISTISKIQEYLKDQGLIRVSAWAD